MTKRQINTLKHILFSYTPQKCRKGYGVGKDCIFNPHHAIIFYNSVKEPIAHIEVCFTCNEYKVYSELGNFSNCDAFYERINSLLNSAGIKKFMEIGREYED